MSRGSRYKRRHKRLQAGQRAIWAPTYVDEFVEKVHLVKGWVMVEEKFDAGKEVPMGLVKLVVVRPGETNVVRGTVVKVSAEDGDLQFHENCGIIYSEFAGGRWSFFGRKVLIMRTRDVLATVQ